MGARHFPLIDLARLGVEPDKVSAAQLCGPDHPIRRDAQAIRNRALPGRYIGVLPRRHRVTRHFAGRRIECPDELGIDAEVPVPPHRIVSADGDAVWICPELPRLPIPGRRVVAGDAAGRPQQYHPSSLGIDVQRARVRVGHRDRNGRKRAVAGIQPVHAVREHSGDEHAPFAIHHQVVREVHWHGKVVLD